jgi:hypothetical protein
MSKSLEKQSNGSNNTGKGSWSVQCMRSTGLSGWDD